VHGKSSSIGYYSYKVRLWALLASRYSESVLLA
jgi:hypothetical protein